MNKIIYYVAVSLDGYISGPNEDVSRFVGKGDGVERYLADLKQFKTVIMGRKTYEFGYKYGLVPGQPAYSHMEHYIFSHSLKLENMHENVHIEPPDVDRIKIIRENSPSDVYLCGGGQFAGWLLDHELIDELILKINPIILGGGVRIFGDSTKDCSLTLIESQMYDNGLQISRYKITS